MDHSPTIPDYAVLALSCITSHIVKSVWLLLQYHSSSQILAGMPTAGAPIYNF